MRRLHHSQRFVGTSSGFRSVGRHPLRSGDGFAPSSALPPSSNRGTIASGDRDGESLRRFHSLQVSTPEPVTPSSRPGWPDRYPSRAIRLESRTDSRSRWHDGTVPDFGTGADGTVDAFDEPAGPPPAATSFRGDRRRSAGPGPERSDRSTRRGSGRTGHWSRGRLLSGPTGVRPAFGGRSAAGRAPSRTPTIQLP